MKRSRQIECPWCTKPVHVETAEDYIPLPFSLDDEEKTVDILARHFHECARVDGMGHTSWKELSDAGREHYIQKARNLLYDLAASPYQLTLKEKPPKL